MIYPIPIGLLEPQPEYAQEARRVADVHCDRLHFAAFSLAQA
jgi:hypothetical protein